MWIAIFVREEVAIALAGLGLLALLTGKEKKWTIVILASTLLWWILCTNVIQPAFGRDVNSALDIGLYKGTNKPIEVYKNLITNTGWIVEGLRAGGLLYLYMIFRHVGFLGILGAEGIIAIPVLASNLFLGRVHFSGSDPFSRFALLSSCTLIFASILIVKRNVERKNWNRILIPIILFFFLPAVSLMDGVKDVTQQKILVSFLGNDPKTIDEGLRLIPKEASVAAPTYTLPILSQRKHLFTLEYLYMYPAIEIEYYFIDRNIDRLLSNSYLRVHYSKLLSELSKSKKYEVIWRQGDYMIYLIKKPE